MPYEAGLSTPLPVRMVSVSKQHARVREHLAQARLLVVAAAVVPVHDARLAAELADQIEIGLGRIRAALARDVGDRHALVVRELALRHPEDLRVLPAHAEVRQHPVEGGGGALRAARGR